MINIIINEKVIRKFLYIILILNIIGLLIFIFFSYQKFGFNSDSAVRVILAKEIYDSGSYFPEDWFFVNGDIWVFSAHTIVIPLLRFFPAGYTVYAFASAVLILAIILAISILVYKLNAEKNNRIVILLLFSSGISLAITENLYGQISYGLILLYYCLILSGILVLLNKQKKTKYVSSIFISCILVIVFWSNPLRGVVFFLIPLGLTLGFQIFLNYKNKEQTIDAKCYIKIIMLITFSVVVGSILNSVTVDKIQMNAGVTQIHWLALSEMIKRIPKLITGILFILGGEPHANRSLFTVSGMYDGFRLLIALCFIALIPYSVRKIFKTEHINNIKIFTFFTFSVFSIIVFLMVATNVYHARYLLPAIVLMVIVVYTPKFDFKNNLIFDTLRIITIVGFITNSFVINSGYWKTYYVSEAHKEDSHSFHDVKKIANYLENKELTYGYATFWNAGSLTVLSDNKVKTRQIYIENGIPQKFKWLSANKWYEPSLNPINTFLLLTKNESKSVNWNLLNETYGLSPEYEYDFEDYKIYIFKGNISSKLSNWED